MSAVFSGLRSPFPGYSRCFFFVAILNFCEREQGIELGSNRTRSSPNKPFSRRFRNFLVVGKSPQRNLHFKLTIPTQAKVNTLKTVKS